MKNQLLILAAAGLLTTAACAPKKWPPDGVIVDPALISPTTSPSPTTFAALTTLWPAPSDATSEITSSFKLDMPFDTAAQLKLPPKVSGDFSIELKVRPTVPTPSTLAPRSSYSGEYRLTLRDVDGSRVLGNWSGTLSGEEGGVPHEVIDRVFKRFGNGAEILRRIVTPEQPKISQ